MHQGNRYRLYPNKEQQVCFAKHFGGARFAYNYALELQIRTWETERRKISQFDLCKIFPKLKKQEGTAWLSDVCSHALQCEMANLDVAFTRFFRDKKGFPKFKVKGSDKQSYSTNVNISVGENWVKIPKVGRVKAVISRPLSGRIVKITVHLTPTGDYYASLLCEDGKQPPNAVDVTEAGTTGVDLGLTHFCTLSNGEKVSNPRYLRKSLKCLRRKQRKLARRKFGGKNYIKQKCKVAAVYEKATNQRRDFQHKLSDKLIQSNQAVAVETLSVSAMLKNRRFAKSIVDAGWATFLGMLDYKAKKRGKTVLRIGRFEPSSKKCACGVINNQLTISDRRWKCGVCGETHDRDILAANNIKRMALNPLNKTIPQELRESTPEELLV